MSHHLGQAGDGERAAASTGADHAESAGSTRVPQHVKTALPERDRHTWSLFADWCTALGQPTLPASPASLAQFLRVHPAAPATQRRRIAVIDAAHYRHALPPPGRVETVRAALDVARTDRLRDFAGLLGRIVARLPESGWPAALFTRRDALILTLASTGLPYTRIAALQIRDVAVDPGIDALHVETGNGIYTSTVQELGGVGASPKHVYRRWCEVLGYHKRYPSNRMLADAIEAEGGAELTGYDRHLDPAGELPLLTPIDRWGHTPLAATPLTSRAIADIVQLHLGGRAPAHLQHHVRALHSESEVAPAPAVVLDHGYYERGILARKNAHFLLGDVDSALADVGTRADRILEDLLEILESEMN